MKKCKSHCIVLTGPVTNAKLTMAPPGIVNPDVKYKLPLQPLQRVFHADSQEEGGHASLNILLHGENDEPEVRTGGTTLVFTIGPFLCLCFSGILIKNDCFKSFLGLYSVLCSFKRNVFVYHFFFSV